jgi:uncharacterized FAD-dependent dehydrogenase
MINDLHIFCSPEDAVDAHFIENYICKKLSLTRSDFNYHWKKRSIDARSKNPRIQGVLQVAVGEPLPPRIREFTFHEVRHVKSVVHIIGAGPAGLFAALECLILGLKPIIFERGKNVRERRRDLAKLNKEGIVNPESNYCFGEGGAGTYSDGKLYTRSKKRGEVDKILELLVFFGASEDILVNTHPHVGTNKLPQLITAIREKILEKGGEIHFGCKLTDLKIDIQNISAIEVNHAHWVKVDQLILATGHSARDVFQLLHRKSIKIQSKPFALGVRIEHTQETIDKIQYHGRVNDQYLPPASYSLVAPIADKGVYSFCMCPGGIIAPCATDNEEVVTNGWSPSKRNNPYANSGIVVSIDPSDFKNSSDPFVCLNFQQEIERKCWELAGKKQQVPAQRLTDFIAQKKSVDFPRSSYQPGITSVQMDEIFPKFITNRLRDAFVEFDKKMPGFLTADAVIHAPESRTSSPVSIPRVTDKLHHIEIENLYPCAEGAGYAGGIVSAAIDGMKCANEISKRLMEKT